METATNISVLSSQFYIIGKRWVSDLEFFRIETTFLHRLLDDYFVKLLDKEHIQRLKQAGMQLYELEKSENNIRRQLEEQMRQLELMTIDVIPENKDSIAEAHYQLEILLADLTKDYRNVKKEIFELVESVMNVKKLIAQ